MKPLSPFRTGEGIPGGPGDFNLGPTEALRLGVLATAVEVNAEQFLRPMTTMVIGGERYDS